MAASSKILCWGINVFANMGWGEVRIPHPLFEGGTLYAEFQVIEKRKSASRPVVGVLSVRTIGYNQNGDIVISFRRTLLVYKRGEGPDGRHRTNPDIDPSD